MSGQTISHYKITDKLGEDGMGVVCKAEDTKLDRPAARKFLSACLVSDEEVTAGSPRRAAVSGAPDNLLDNWRALFRAGYGGIRVVGDC